MMPFSLMHTVDIPFSPALSTPSHPILPSPSALRPTPTPTPLPSTPPPPLLTIPQRLNESALRFVEGYFNESLPALLQAEPNITFAVSEHPRPCDVTPTPPPLSSTFIPSPLLSSPPLL